MKLRSIYLLISLLGFCSCIYDDQNAYELKVGDYLPDFSVEMNDGTRISSSYLKETVSCIVFFHTTCPDCRETLPEVQKLYDRFSSDVRFVLISREETDASIAGYWKENSLTMPYSAQSDRSVYSIFAQSRIPRVYICSKGGKIEAVFTDEPDTPSYDDMAEVLSDELIYK